MEAQERMILNHMREHKSITALEALNEYRCFRLAARINDLRKLGHNIITEMVETEYGKRVAEYYLINEAKQ